MLQADQSKSTADSHIPNKVLKKSTAYHGVPVIVKVINSSDVFRSEKTLGCGTFGVCYLAHYRGIMVAVKEFKLRSESSLVGDGKREVLNDANMISRLGDHHGYLYCLV